jgi:hypothetical protein
MIEQVLDDLDLELFAMEYFQEDDIVPLSSDTTSIVMENDMYYTQQQERELKLKLAKLRLENEQLTRQLSQTRRDQSVIDLAKNEMLDCDQVGIVIVHGTRIVFMNDLMRFKLGLLHLDLKRCEIHCEDLIHRTDVSRLVGICIKNILNRSRMAIIDHVIMKQQGNHNSSEEMVFCKKLYWQYMYHQNKDGSVYKIASEGRFYF